VARQLKSMLVGAFVVGLAAGFIFFQAKLDAQQEITIVQQASYLSVTREDMIDSADAIFLGKVIAISSTRWNQDSGEEWNDDAIGGDSGIQIHTIEVEILRPIVDVVGLGDHITITALGISPVDGQSDHNLKEGNQAVFFVMQTELAWRGKTTRPIFELIGAPTESYYLQGSDGLYYSGRPDTLALSLENIIKIIAERRADLIQP